MKNSLPLHSCHAQTLSIFINRSHLILHSIAIAFLIYFRASFLFQETKTKPAHTLPWLLLFGSELLLSFNWLLGVAYRWRPVDRKVFPERLPKDDKLPAIDVFICTADPSKEPTVGVMNTVLSAMALDYPPEKLNVYLSDDGGADITLHGMREARRFAKWWVPFCRKYKIKNRCPQAYFEAPEEGDNGDCWSFDQFMEERKMIKKKYEMFEDRVIRARKVEEIGAPNNSSIRNHPTVIEVIQDDSNEALEEDQLAKLPLLVYVAREKKPSNPHHFKAGALNVLLRVSGLMSNSPYILGLDCDMYCNDPTSAKQAMCFHLDPHISPSLSFVQFPQRFHNINTNDIYDGHLRSAFGILWQGLDGHTGPILSGTGYYIKRDSLYGISVENGIDLAELQNSFGESKEFIRSLRPNYRANRTPSASLKEANILASCTYDNDTKWGKEVGFLYDSVTEDLFTGYMLHCKGWTSVYLNPERPQFLGASVTSLNDLLIQGTRWSSGLLEVGLSKYCPFIYGPLRMSFLESMCYGEITSFPLMYCLSLWCFATIPQLCLLNGIPLYPEVPSTFFGIFVFIFLSSLSKLIHEILITGGSIQTLRNEQSIWMIKSVTSHLYGSLDAILKKLGVREASFMPTNKAVDDEQEKLYKMGKLNFQTSPMFLVPLATLVILNISCLIGGVTRTIFKGNWEQMFLQICLSLYILAVGYAVVEGMIIRKDKGRIPQSITLLSAVLSVVLLLLGSVILNY